MGKHELWDAFFDWKEKYEWVDLSHPLSPKTPHWEGFPTQGVSEFLNLDDSIFLVHEYTNVGQYGTHVDAPSHMLQNARSLDEIGVEEMICPLCVIDKRAEVERDCDFIMRVSDIQSFEQEHGPIPEGAFVVFCSGWSKRNDLDNLDQDGNRHFPAWDMQALQYLFEERKAGGIGHETSDTESPLTSGKTNYDVERYVLAQDKIQAELLANVEKCPPMGALIFVTFPKVVGGSGFPARCFALCPKE